MNAFEILGIEPTEDKKTIKKAYASLVKKYHPEEDMQKWQEIYEAYQRALEWAEGRNYLTKTATVPVHPSEEDTEKTLWQQNSSPAKENILPGKQEVSENASHEKEQDETELNELFDNLEELSTAIKEEKNEQEKQKLEKALAILDHMNLFPELVYEDWEELLSKEEYRHAVSQSAFLDKWSELLVKRSIDKRLYQLMDEKLKSIVQYQADSEQTVKKEGLIDPVQLTGIRIRAAYDRYREKRKKRNRIAVFIILVLLKVISSIYKMHEQTNRTSKMEQLTNMIDEMESAMFSEITLENITETTLHLADASWDGLAKFLMRADEEILSMVLPYTQTLESGVLILEEEFEISEALQGKKEKEDISNTENSYELVPLSLPFDNKIRVGKETIDLSKEAIRFAIRTEGDADSVLLWVDPGKMGFKEGCEIYYFNGEEYQRIGKVWNDDGMPTGRHYYDVLTYRVFWVQVSRPEENEFPVIMAPIK